VGIGQARMAKYKKQADELKRKEMIAKMKKEGLPTNGAPLFFRPDNTILFDLHGEAERQSEECMHPMKCIQQKAFKECFGVIFPELGYLLMSQGKLN
jgi:hypothetical protein